MEETEMERGEEATKKLVLFLVVEIATCGKESGLESAAVEL